MKNVIKKIIKWFSPPTIEIGIDGKRYKLVFGDFEIMEWVVRVEDLSTNKTIGYINIPDESIVNRTLWADATREINKLIRDNESEEERKNKRKESMRYYFGE